VEGPAGIGKSALIAAVRDRAVIDGVAVLSARGAELERGFSFGVVWQLLGPALASLCAGEREAVLAAPPARGARDGPERHELATLRPIRSDRPRAAAELPRSERREPPMHPREAGG